MPIIAIIGIDGCGKTTQAKLLVQRLNKEGYEAEYIRPIYILLNTLSFGTRIKNEKISFPISPRKSSTTQKYSLRKNDKFSLRSILLGLLLGPIGYLYALISYLFINLCLGRNKIIVCDRFFYQFFFDLFGTSSEKIIKLFPKPDITFLLYGDLNLFYRRMEKSLDATINERYYIDVMNLYENLANKYNFIRIDASLDKEYISDTILNRFFEFNEGKKLEGDCYV
jgi:thymidylate kinase